MILRTAIGAFMLSEDSISAMESLKKDRMFFRCQIEVQTGGMENALPFLADKITPPLLIIESSGNASQLLEQLDKLAGVCDPDTKLILIGSENDIDLYRTLKDAGVSDYLVAPIDTEKLRSSIINAYSESGVTSEGGKTIAFFGVSGGVGSSTISHNVAHELATRLERRVTLIDLDICFGTAALNFNVQPRQTITDAIAQYDNLNQDLFDKLLLEADHNLLALYAPASLNSGLQLSLNVIEKLIQLAKEMSDFIILDVPHGWGALTVDILALVDDLVVVARPELTALRDAKNILEVMGPKREMGTQTRLILNHVDASKKNDLSIKDIRDALAMTPEACIPHDPDSFGLCLNNGEMLSASAPKSTAAAEISKFSDIIGSSKIIKPQAENKKTKKEGFSLKSLLSGKKSTD